MGAEALVKEQIEAGEHLARDYSDFAPVDVLFWLKDAENGNWYLHLASPKLVPQNMGDAYREIVQLFAKHKYRWLDMFRINLLNSADPLATEVTRIRDFYPLPRARDYDGTSIAGVQIEGAYIYPPLATASSAA